MPSSRGSSQPRSQTWVSCIAGRFFTVGAPLEMYFSLFISYRADARYSFLKEGGRSSIGWKAWDILQKYTEALPSGVGKACFHGTVHPKECLQG